MIGQLFYGGLETSGLLGVVGCNAGIVCYFLRLLALYSMTSLRLGARSRVWFHVSPSPLLPIYGSFFTVPHGAPCSIGVRSDPF